MATSRLQVAHPVVSREELRQNKQGFSSLRLGGYVSKTIPRGYRVPHQVRPRRHQVATKLDNTFWKATPLETTHPRVRLRHHSSSWAQNKAADAFSRIHIYGTDQRPLDDEIPTVNLADWIDHHEGAYEHECLAFFDDFPDTLSRFLEEPQVHAR